jgi:hypothetical protein
VVFLFSHHSKALVFLLPSALGSGTKFSVQSSKVKKIVNTFFLFRAPHFRFFRARFFRPLALSFASRMRAQKQEKSMGAQICKLYIGFAFTLRNLCTLTGETQFHCEFVHPWDAER